MSYLPRTNSKVWYKGPHLFDNDFDNYISTINMYCPTLITLDDTTFTIDSSCRVLSYTLNLGITIDSTYVLIDSTFTTIDED